MCVVGGMCVVGCVCVWTWTWQVEVRCEGRREQVGTDRKDHTLPSYSSAKAVNFTSYIQH